MNSIDSELFDSIRQSKKVTDIYLGHVIVPWRFSFAECTADCTEATPLNLFERAVCGLLNINSEMNFTELGKILGLNIIDEPQSLIFKDKAEEEFLLENLNTLKEYGMITSGDDFFSHIRLTDIGREYYSLRKKFKKGLTRKFTIYYDLETLQHSKAKQIFSSLSNSSSGKNIDMPKDLMNESFIKTFAHEQIPKIYDESIGNSFTNLIVQKYVEKVTRVKFGVVYNILEKSLKLVIEPDSKLDKDYLQSSIDKNEELRQRIISDFIEKSPTSNDINPSQDRFEESLIKLQSDIDYALYLHKPDEVKNKVDYHYEHTTIFEEGMLYLILQKVIKREENKEIFISVPSFDNCDKTKIKSLSDIDGVTIYLVIGTIDNETPTFPSNVFLVNLEQIKEMIVLDDSYIIPSQIIFNLQNKPISTKCYERHFESTTDEFIKLKESIATILLPRLIKSYEDFLNYDWENSDCHETLKESITILENCDKDIIKFDNFLEELGYSAKLLELNNNRNNIISTLKAKHIEHLSSDFKDISQVVVNDISSLEDINSKYSTLDAFLSRLNDAKEVMNEMIDIQFINQICELEKQEKDFRNLIIKQEDSLKNKILPKIYVIDTNIFILCPTICDYISKDDKVVVSIKVLDELDSLKTKLSGKEKVNVKKAIRAIHERIRMKSVEVKKAKIDILPPELQRNSGDYMILSIAYEYKLNKDNVFLLTKDLNFQNIAMGLEITIGNLEDIVPKGEIIDIQKKNKTIDRVQLSSNVSDVPKELWELLLYAWNSFENQSEISLADYTNRLTSYDKTFSYRKYGFKKMKDLCLAYPNHIELFKNDDNVLCIKLK